MKIVLGQTDIPLFVITLDTGQHRIITNNSENVHNNTSKYQNEALIH